MHHFLLGRMDWFRNFLAEAPRTPHLRPHKRAGVPKKSGSQQRGIYNALRRRKANSTAPETTSAAAAARASRPPPPVLGRVVATAELAVALAMGLTLALALAVALAPSPTVTVTFMKGCIVQ